MNRNLFTLLLSVVAAGAFLAPAGRALADDESDEVQIEIKAPLDAVACDVAPQTITVLGLTIDVTNAVFDDGSEGESDDDASDVSSASSASGSDDEGDDDGEDVDDDDSEDGVGAPATCADLLVGRSVEVKLSSDVAPLVATEVEGKNEDEIEIQAPIQALDTTLGTITLLGLPIDISSVRVEGCDDEDDEDGNQGIDPTTLLVGQFVEVELDPNALPALVARELEVKNFSNTVEIDVEDASGNDIDDVDDDGQPMPTVSIDVTQSVRPAASSGKGSKGSTRTLHFRARSNGRTVLHGLPTGRARVSVSRSASTSTSSGRGSVTIAPNSTSSTTIRLKGSKGSKGPKSK